MNNNYTSYGIAIRLWLLTAAILAASLILWLLTMEDGEGLFMFAMVVIASLIGSIPSLVVMLIFVWVIYNSSVTWQGKLRRLLLLLTFTVLCYAGFAALIDFPITVFYNDGFDRFIQTGLQVFALLLCCASLAFLILLRILASYFSNGETGVYSYNSIFLSLFQNKSKNNHTMETFNYENQPSQQTQSNKLLIKGLITGGLILLMLIPTIFINNLIKEREARQKEVVKEVSSKWATAQVIAGPYIVVPYTEPGFNSDNKPVFFKKKLVLLANSLDVNGSIFPETRPRSIYKVLLYKTNVNLKGVFKPTWPADINTANIDFANAKICFGLSDFKGVEEEIFINCNGQKIPLTPGLPSNELGDIGLSAPVKLSFDSINAGFAFDMQVKIKGSEQLHFMPLSANSKFTLQSSWASPSFDGNSLPNERIVSEKRFTAKWNFNQANLPFGTVVQSGTFNKTNLAFGVSMVQPADQYNKTMRSVKYAILFIGLTFALFFIVEIMQRKPFHPVQYVLVGMALVIFDTLLLSISEYLVFDHAYLIAASATIMLITTYAKSHFESWKTAAVLFSVLSCLYGFIFILIRLEDTALIIGSIGLFLVLAIVMYVSRKINWYGNSNSLVLKTS